MKRAILVATVCVMAMGLGWFAPQASATSYDPLMNWQLQPFWQANLPAGLQPFFWAEPIWNQGGQGDALYGDFYRTTVTDTNFLTYVSIENTSANWVAAHVRLRCGRYSIEILDFPILLSPYDVFWFQFEAIPDVTGAIDKVIIWSYDTKTLGYSDLPVDANGKWEQTIQTTLLENYASVVDAGFATKEELTIGDIEVIGLFQTGNQDGLTFKSLMGKFYSAASNATVDVNGNPIYQRNVIPFDFVVANDVGTSLSGHVFMGDFTNGLYVGYGMNALRNFRTNGGFVNGAYVPGYYRDLDIRFPAVVSAGAIVYNIAGDAAYTDPDWATFFGPTWNDGSNSAFNLAPDVVNLPGVAAYSVDEVEDALVKQNIRSTYFNTAFTGNTYTLLVLAYPAKYLHVFFDRNNSCLPGPAGFVWPVGDVNQAYAVRQQINVPTYAGVTSLLGSIWDLEEKTPYNPISPQVFPNLKWEVNCLPIGADSRIMLTDFCFLVHQDSSPFDLSGVEYPAGQFFLTGFEYYGCNLFADPRNISADYDNTIGVDGVREVDSKLGNLSINTIAVSGVVMDWDFTNFAHARAYRPAWQ